MFNAILVRGDAIGDVVFYGRGAGKWPTASAVVADVIDCAKHLGKRKVLDWDVPVEGEIADISEIPFAFYVRGTLPAGLNAEAAAKAVGAEKILQIPNAPENEVALLTGKQTEAALRASLAAAGFAPDSILRVTEY